MSCPEGTAEPDGRPLAALVFSVSVAVVCGLAFLVTQVSQWLRAAGVELLGWSCWGGAAGVGLLGWDCWGGAAGVGLLGWGCWAG